MPNPISSLAEEWIKNSPHKTWCNKAPGNIYADGEDCDCGLEAALNSLSSPAVPKEITLQKRTLEDLINLAAEILPKEWEIIIEPQQGYGEVIIHKPDGSLFEDDTSITQQYANALSLAKIEDAKPFARPLVCQGCKWQILSPNHCDRGASPSYAEKLGACVKYNVEFPA